MEKTREIITRNEKRFPNFKEYLKILNKIEENVVEMPDVSIECCKSLVDGISKTVLKSFNVTYIEKGRDADSSGKLLNKVFDILSKYVEIDKALAQSSVGIVCRINEIRNDSGDISHGRTYPKVKTSSSELSELVVGVADEVLPYILKIYFNLEIDNLEVRYEDNSEFNDALDSEFELAGVKYSKALFDQDFVAYKEQLNNFISENDTSI